MGEATLCKQVRRNTTTLSPLDPLCVIGPCLQSLWSCVEPPQMLPGPKRPHAAKHTQRQNAHMDKIRFNVSRTTSDSSQTMSCSVHIMYVHIKYDYFCIAAMDLVLLCIFFHMYLLKKKVSFNNLEINMDQLWIIYKT